MNTKSQKLMGLLGMAIVATMAWTGQAVAKDDGKFYPGLMCVDQYGPTSARSQVGYASTGSVFNNSTTKTATVSCQIVEDKVRTGKGIDRVTVHYTNNHPTKNVSCALQLRGNGPTQHLFNKKMAANLPGKKNGFFTVYGFSETQNDPAHFLLLCNIPPHSKGTSLSQIHAYSIYEDD